MNTDKTFFPGFFPICVDLCSAVALVMSLSQRELPVDGRRKKQFIHHESDDSDDNDTDTKQAVTGNDDDQQQEQPEFS